MNRRHRRARAVRLCAAALLVAAGTILAVPARASAADAAASSCVACHTDAEKLKAESAAIPQPKGSALQAGKG